HRKGAHRRGTIPFPLAACRSCCPEKQRGGRGPSQKGLPPMGDVFKHRTTRYLDADGRQVNKDTPSARKVTVESNNWYGEYPHANDIPQRVRLSPEKAAARIGRGELMKEAELTRRGLADPTREEHLRRPLTEHLEDWKGALLAEGATAKHVE